MAFLPPVIMEIRAQAAQFFATVDEVAAATRGMADETVAAADGMATKTGAAADKMGSSVVSAAEVMATKTAAEAEAMAREIIAQTEIMDEGASAAAEDMARKIAASFEAMAAKTTASAESQAARTTAALEAQSAKIAAQQEIMANKVAESAAKTEAAEARAAAAVKSAAGETEAAGLKMQSTFERTALSAVSSMGTVTSAFAGAAMTQVSAAKGAEANLMGVANGVTKVAAVAGLAIAGIGLDMAAHFQKSTTLLVTAGGEAKNNLEYVRQGILGIATSTGTSTEQLSEGMYVMEKAGYRGAAGLAALQASAEGAKAENVDLGTMTQATTDILLDYGYKMGTAKDATASSVSVVNQLVAASGAAKTTMQDFAASMAAVVPIASSAHISFAEVGGAIATMTQHGQTAQQSSQNLANLIQSLIRPNLQASAAMQQMGIDTTDLAQHLGDTGLSGALSKISSALRDHMGPDMMVAQDTMQKNANATRDLKAEMAAMPPELAKMSQGLLDNTVTQKDYQKAVKDSGGSAGALGNNFLSLYKSSDGVNKSMQSGGAIFMTYQAALTKVLGNVTAARAATMLLMNNSEDLSRSIDLVTTAAHQSGQHISTWAETQSQLSTQLDMAKQRSATLAIELGTQLIPAANGALAGFADLIHGFEEGNPVLNGIALLLGGVVTVAIANYTIKMVEAGVATVLRLKEMGANAILMGQNFVAGFVEAQAASSALTGKAGSLGGMVRSTMVPALGAAAGAAVLLGGAMMGLSAAQQAWGTNDTAPKLDQIQKALASLANSADKTSKAQMDNLFKSFDSGALKAAPKNVNDLDSAIKAVTHEGFDDTMNKVGDAISSAFGQGNTSAISQVEDRIKGMGDALGQMVQGGNLDSAATDFNKLAASYEKNGKSAQEALDAMPGYKKALQDLAAQTGQTLAPQQLLELAMGQVPDSMKQGANAVKTYTDAGGNMRTVTDQMKASLDNVGVGINGEINDLGKLYDAMVKTGLANLSARDAEFRFGDATRAAGAAADDLKSKLGGNLASALNTTGDDFNKTTAAGKTAEDQFSAVTQAGLTTASTMAHDVTKSAGDVTASLHGTYDAMVATAEKFGLGDVAAKNLAGSVLGIPKGVTVDTWMADTAKKMAEQTKGAVDNIPGRKDVTINIVPTGEQRFIDAALGVPLPPASIRINPDDSPAKATGGLLGHLPGRAMGGLLAYAGGGSPLLDVGPGGLLRGPGSGTSDSILARVSNGEFVVREAMVQHYGVPFMEALNNGSLGASSIAPVNTPQLAYAGVSGGGSSSTTNNHRTVNNSVVVHAGGVDARAFAAELGHQLQLMS